MGYGKWILPGGMYRAIRKASKDIKFDGPYRVSQRVVLAGEGLRIFGTAVVFNGFDPLPDKIVAGIMIYSTLSYIIGMITDSYIKDLKNDKLTEDKTLDHIIFREGVI